MSDPQEAVSTIQPQNQVDGTAPEPQPQEQPQQPQGTDFIDFGTAPPDQIEARFKRVYGNMKEFERDNAALRQHIAQLSQVVQDIQVRGAEASEASQRHQLMQRLLAAKEAGNVQEEVRLQGELSTLSQRTPRPVPIPPPPPGQNSDVTAVEQWSREVGQDGNFRRPWALEGHPRYAEAYNLVASLVSDPRFTGNTDGILAEVDRRMGVSQGLSRPAGSSVISSTGQVRPAQDGDPNLSAEELRIAQKFGISPSQYSEQRRMIERGGRAYSVPTVAPRRQAR